MGGFSSVEDEILVELVSKNPPIYDVRLQSYKDNIVRDNIWEDIGVQMNKTGTECKKRWKHIRDSFSRCKRKKLPTGSSATSKKTKWALFERLRFLENIPKERRSISNVQEDDIIDGEESDYEAEREREEGSGGGISIEETGGGMSYEGGSGAGAGIAGTSGIRMSTEEIGGGNEGGSSAGIASVGTSRGAKSCRKRKGESSLHLSLLKYLTERDKERREQIKTLSTQEEPADPEGISSFCSHIGSILAKLTPALRVEAKSKVFSILADYELKNLKETSLSQHTQHISLPIYITEESGASSPQSSVSTSSSDLSRSSVASNSEQSTEYDTYLITM